MTFASAPGMLCLLGPLKGVLKLGRDYLGQGVRDLGFGSKGSGV